MKTGSLRTNPVLLFQMTTVLPQTAALTRQVCCLHVLHQTAVPIHPGCRQCSLQKLGHVQADMVQVTWNRTAVLSGLSWQCCLPAGAAMVRAAEGAAAGPVAEDGATHHGRRAGQHSSGAQSTQGLMLYQKPPQLTYGLTC